MTQRINLKTASNRELQELLWSLAPACEWSPLLKVDEDMRRDIEAELSARREKAGTPRGTPGNW